MCFFWASPVISLPGSWLAVRWSAAARTPTRHRSGQGYSIRLLHFDALGSNRTSIAKPTGHFLAAFLRQTLFALRLVFNLIAHQLQHFFQSFVFVSPPDQAPLGPFRTLQTRHAAHRASRCHKRTPPTAIDAPCRPGAMSAPRTSIRTSRLRLGRLPLPLPLLICSSDRRGDGRLHPHHRRHPRLGRPRDRDAQEDSAGSGRGH